MIVVNVVSEIVVAVVVAASPNAVRVMMGF